MFSLEGKTAIVTGGASGIGLATVRRFASASAKVAIADITEATALAGEVKGLFLKTDVTIEDQVKALMDEVAGAWGRIDIVVNNAGGGSTPGPLTEYSAEDFEFDYRLNLTSVVFGMKHAVGHMTNGGSIINTASVAGVRGVLEYGPYVASKAGVIGLTKTAALEFAPQNIRVNCVCPGTVDTPMAYWEGEEHMLKLGPLKMPLGRLCAPEEVAALIHFLAADDCAFVSGQAICIDGGMTAGFGRGLLDPLLEKL